MIRVMVVDDSLSVRILLRDLLKTDPLIQVVELVDSGEAAIRFLAENKKNVDVIIMSINMPGLDGFTTTRYIMETTPLPIVIVSSSSDPAQTESSIKAVEAGAVAIVEKPVATTHGDYHRLAAGMIETVKTMAGVKVVTRWAKGIKTIPRKDKGIPEDLFPGNKGRTLELLLIGSSTGGPPGLQTILSILSREFDRFPLAILIVQHINPGFIERIARWLQQGTGFQTGIPISGEIIVPGQVYLAADHYHMGIQSGYQIVLEKSPLEYGHRPSVSYLFRSAALNYPRTCIGVLLSGMGNDGAAELKVLRDCGSLTIVQDEKSSVVFGMPGEAVKLNAAHFILPPQLIAEQIVKTVKSSNGIAF
jgi:two-component system chemotaxis response regulator CheB